MLREGEEERIEGKSPGCKHHLPRESRLSSFLVIVTKNVQPRQSYIILNVSKLSLLVFTIDYYADAVLSNISGTNLQWKGFR